MANKTSYLDLILPGFGEYRDSWWDPLNDNFTTVDGAIESVTEEVRAARSGESSLYDFLSIGHNMSDGTLNPTQEMIDARNSPIYGFQNDDMLSWELAARLKKIDWEIWNARASQEDLRASLALRTPFPTTSILSGTKDSNGYPTWMNVVGNNVVIDGSITNIMLSIDGNLARIRTQETLPITGGDGIKYLYAQYLPDFDAGKVVVDGEAISPDTPDGATSLDLNSKKTLFNDITQNFWDMTLNSELMPGDILDVIDTTDAGKYLVKEIIESSTPGTSTQFSIIGLFPGPAGIASINYKIYDPLKVSLGFDTSEVPAAGKIYLGEVYMSGGSLTDFPSETGVKIKIRHFKDTFVGEWRSVDISGTNGTPNLGTSVPGIYETKYAHNLGSDILDIIVQASSANDGSQPVEELCVGAIDASTLGVSINSSGLGLSKNSTLSFSSATHGTDAFDPGSGDASFAQGAFSGGALSGTIDYSLTGSVTGSMTGSVYMENGIKVKWNKNYIWIKNAVTGKFYKDYSGSVKQTGYIRVVVRKRG